MSSDIGIPGQVVVLISCAIYLRRRQQKIANGTITAKQTQSVQKPIKLPGDVTSEFSDTYENYGVNNSYEVYRLDNSYEEYTDIYQDYQHFRSNFFSK